MPIVAQFILDNLDYLQSLREKKSIFIGLTLCVYFVSVSGGMYDIIRNPAAFHCRYGKCVFINPNGSQQFVLEGFLVGLFSMGCSVSLFILLKYFLKVFIYIY